MKFTIKSAEYVSKLARLALTIEEKEEFANDISRIIMYVEKLNELDTTDVEPTSHLLSLKNVLRNDEPICISNRDDILKNAPKEKDDCFLVPRIME
jgi:aspartyl-tRNA(Asn)/glutamyl-tRNA(Gln) amidotransferase subunit C